MSYAAAPAPTTTSTSTLDGVADDGLAGEADNVGTTVENIVGGGGDDDLTGTARRTS